MRTRRNGHARGSGNGQARSAAPELAAVDAAWKSAVDTDRGELRAGLCAIERRVETGFKEVRQDLRELREVVAAKED